MKMPAHMHGIDVATNKPEPVMIPVDQIASTGHTLDKYENVEKVKRMRAKLEAGGELPPIRVSPLTPELRDRCGIADPTKKFYLESGHHRLAASKLEGLKKISAVSYHEGKRL
jgi:hypothetical protein